MVTRLGRICVLGNRAKLVTVYERRIAPTEQFADQQHDLSGRAIIRKAQEYIEFLDVENDFTDQVDSRQHGCVVGCSFANGGKGKVHVPVDSLWGQDVNSPPVEGWILPLWNPRADPANYPLPAAALKLVGDTGMEARQLTNPDSLFFFTETGGAFSGNPASWPWIPGLDGPLVGPLVGPSGFLIQNETSVVTELDRFTYTFLGEPPKANVVSGRSASNLVARMVNVSLSRTIPASRAPSPASVIAAASREFMEVAAETYARAWAEQQVLKIDPRKAGDIWGRVIPQRVCGVEDPWL